MKRILFIFTLLFAVNTLIAEDGYRLWLRDDKISDIALLEEYAQAVTGWMVEGNSPTLNVAADELQAGLSGLLGMNMPSLTKVKKDGAVIAGTPLSSPVIASMKLGSKLAGVNEEGFIILSITYKRRDVTVIAANSDIGVLYGVFHFLGLMQTHKSLSSVNISSAPKTRVRILNHWDNLNRSVERGYAGLSLWNWEALPDTLDPRYTDYARANASIGINGAVLTNVNANALILTKEYLGKVAALANVFRPYGVKVYLTARFSAPVEIGKLKTADPLDPEVIDWWKRKVDEIYTYVPDFGGFVDMDAENPPKSACGCI